MLNVQLPPAIRRRELDIARAALVAMPSVQEVRLLLRQNLLPVRFSSALLVLRTHQKALVVHLALPLRLAQRLRHRVHKNDE